MSELKMTQDGRYAVAACWSQAQGWQATALMRVWWYGVVGSDIKRVEGAKRMGWLLF
jgi:hypothetical protein